MATTVIGDLFVRLGVDLTNLNKGFASAESRLEKFGTQMFFLGSRITAGVGLPFAAASGAVTKWGMEFDKAMTESLAIMDNVAPAVRSQMEGVAKSVVNFSKFSAAEGAEGFYHLASAGLDAVTMMGALPIAVRFAQAGVMDLAQATEFLASAQAAMSTGTETAAEKVEQMARVADVLTLANNRALGTIQDFAEALTNKAGAALRLYHKDIEEGVAVLAAYASQGVKGKAAGQQLMMVMRDLGTHALKNADAFARFNIAVYDARGNMKNMAAIIGDVERATLKMSDAEVQSMLLQLGIPMRSVNATKALIGYSDAIRAHEAALREAGGTTQKVADEQMKALSNQVLQLWNQFKTASIEIFQSFVPVFRDSIIPLMKWALDQFKAFGAMLADMPAPLKMMTVGALGLGIAIGPLVATVGSFSLLLDAMLKGLGLVTKGLGNWALSTGLAAGGAQALVLNSTQLNAAMLASYVAAVNAANAQGIFGAAAIDAGLAAQAETAAVNELNAAQAASAARLGILGRLWGAVTSPLVLATTATFGAVSALRYLQGATDEAGKQLSLWETTVQTGKGTFQFLKDILYVIGVGWSDLAKVMSSGVQDALVTVDSQIRRTTGATDDWNLSALRSAPILGGLITVLDNYGVKLDQMVPKIDTLANKWNQWMLQLEMRNFNPEAEAARMNALFMSKHPKASLFTGTKTGPLKPDWWMSATDPFRAQREMEAKAAREAGVGNMPAPLAPDHPAQLTAAQRMFNELSGKDMQDNINATTEAFRKLVAAGKDIDPVVHERMWEAYKKLRGETSALVPEFEHLFKEEIDQYNLQQKLANQDNITPWYPDVKLSTSALKTMNAQLFVSKDAAKAMEDVSDMAAKSTAKMVDAETELERFGKSAGQAHRSTLKSNLAKIEQDQDEHYRDALKKLSLFTGDEHTKYVQHLNDMRAADDRYRELYVANETGKYAASLGVTQRLLRNWESYTQKRRDQIIAEREQWLDYVRVLNEVSSTVAAMGGLFTAVGGGFAELGVSLDFAAKNMKDFLAAGEEIQNGNMAKGIAMAGTAAVNALKQMQDTGSRFGRMAIGAEAGFMMGGPVGAVVGAIAGAFMKDPAWKKVQDSVDSQWNIHVTKELANTIAADAKTLGNRVAGMLMHMSEIAGQAGGMTADNADAWASRLNQTFDLVAQHEITTAQAGKILDGAFKDVLAAGTTTNGIVNEQITRLAQLEVKYKTGSVAVREFIDAQLGMASGGLDKLVKGTFGLMIKQLDDYEKAVKDADDPTKVKNPFENLVPAETQESFDRMGRLVVTTFQAMMSSGRSLIDTLNILGPQLDTLSAAQSRFGLTSSDTFQQLMKFRDFANMNPELVDMISGLDNLMKGLSNSGFMTQATFTDLGVEITDTFNRLIQGGLSGDEALQLMHPTLQTLWELQQKFGFSLDEATQKLLDEAEASGTVGKDYMSANDKMVLGIETLISKFDLFLKHLGIDTRTEAEKAADAINEEMNKVNPQVYVDVHYRKHDEGDETGDRAEPREPEMATGGVLTRPTHVLAGEAGAEAIIPLDRLFEEVRMMNQQAGDEYLLPLTLQMEGESVLKAIVKVGRKRGWVK